MEETSFAAKPEPETPWLTRFTYLCIALAVAAGMVWLWAKWGLVVAMSRDVLKYCF